MPAWRYGVSACVMALQTWRYGVSLERNDVTAWRDGVFSEADRHKALPGTCFTRRRFRVPRPRARKLDPGLRRGWPASAP